MPVHGSQDSGSDFSRENVIRLFEHLTQSEFEVVRLKAVQSLQKLDAVESAQFILKSLDDEDEDVRIDSAVTLGQFCFAAAIDKLMEHLKFDAGGEVKVACVNALAQLEARVAIPVLRNLINDRGKEINWDEDEFLHDGWDSWLDVQIAAINALARMKDEEAIEPICQAMEDPQGQDLDSVATDALASIGRASIKHLANLSNSKSRHRRYCVVRALTRINSSEIRELLDKATKDQDATIRVLAFGALLETDIDHSLIERALMDSSEDVRLTALKFVNFDGGELITKILDDPSTKVNLAFLNKIDGTVICDDRDDIIHKTLELLYRSEDIEVSSSSFGLIAARSTHLVEDRLKDLFSGKSESLETLERRQWSVVDKLAVSSHPMALYWLQLACKSEFRAVKLKALAVLGEKMNNARTDSKTGTKIREFIVSKIKELSAGSRNEQLKLVENSKVEWNTVATKSSKEEQLAELETPNSSLDEILKGDLAEKQIVMAESEMLDEKIQLSDRESVLLAKSKRKFVYKNANYSMDGYDSRIDTCKLAIKLLADNNEAQQNLLELSNVENEELKISVFAALRANLHKFGKSINSKDLDDVIKKGLFSDSSEMKSQMIQLIRYSDHRKELTKELLQMDPNEEPSLIRVKILELKCLLDGHAVFAMDFIQDQSLQVRRQSMKLIAKYSPELVNDHLLNFLLENPDLSISEFLDENYERNKQLGSNLILCLKNRDYKSVWPTIMAAIVAILSQEPDLKDTKAQPR